ncbi:MAG TPA: hypothetical protein VEY51_01600 [Chondromyces sp.]|nr:hypothetical protein [Chondromyces sp.]
MLRKYGRDNPESGMLQKVKRIHFSEKIEIRDPGTREIDKKDVKNFMVNQTSILLERDQLVLSPFDDMVWKQMMDYQVVRISQNGKPIYTSENEHALDALMLTILGFTIEFPNITKILEEIKVARKVLPFQNKIQESLQEKVFGGERDVYQPIKSKPEREEKDNPRWHWQKVALGYSKRKVTANPWGRGQAKGIGLSRSKF